MLAALGLLGVMMAGFALPMAFGEDDDEDNREADASEGMNAPTDPADTGTTNGASNPLDAATAPDEDAEDDFLPDPDQPEDGLAVEKEEGNTDAVETEAVDTEEEEPAPGIRLDGTPEDDALLGTEGDDDLGGSGGDDTLTAGGGDDLLFGDDGDDSLLGGDGDDRIADGSGNDTLLGGEGDDTLSTTPADGAAASDGRDVLDGGAGDDRLILSAQDHATGGTGADTFLLGPGLSPLGIGDHAEIADFDPEEDSIVVIWNDFTSDVPPELDVRPVAGHEDVMAILADGIEIAHLAGAADLELSRIDLVGVSQVATGGG